MKKQVFKLFLLFSVIAVMLCGLVACGDKKQNDEAPPEETKQTEEHVHVGGKATCLSAAICSECEKEYGEKNASNHAKTAEWIADATSHKKKYPCCGIEEEASNHTYKDGKCEVCGFVCNHSGGTASCSALAICEYCSKEYGEKNNSNHTKAAEWSADNASHKQIYPCCNAETEAVKHTYKDGKCETCEHICTHSGGTASCSALAICEHCTKEYGEYAQHPSEEAYQKDDSYHWHNATCSHTNEKVDYEIHQYESVITPPTCEEQGYTTYTCKCGASYVFDYVIESGHTHQNEFDYNELQHWYVATCAHTNEKVELENHIFREAVTPPTCNEQGYTTYTCECGYSYKDNYTDPAGHSVSNWSQSNPRLSDESCCEYEIDYVGTCSVCQTQQTKTEKFEKHSFYWKSVNPATCNSSGTRVKLCTSEACRYHSEQSPKQTEEYTDANAHVWDGGAVLNDTVLYTCIHCGEEKTVVSSNSASASVSGSSIQNVDEIKISDITIGFDSGIKSNLADAQKVTIGANVLSGDEKNEAIKDYELSPEQIAALGNKPIYDFTLNNGNNISNLGGTATIRIPYELADGENPNEIIVWYISQGELTPIKAEYKDGYVEFTTIHFSYYIPSGLSAKEYCAIYGHPEDSQKSFAPTCTAEGYTICLHCGEITSKTAPTGHLWGSTVLQNPTCDTTGITEYECSACHTTYQVNTTPLGHIYSITSYEAPTCIKQGTLTYACSRCSHSYVKTQAKLEHKYSLVTKEATCTEAGYTEHTCTMCADTTITNLTKPLGHLYDNTWHQSGEGHYHVCERCSEADKIHAHVPGDEATETSAQICTECEYVLTPQIAHKHSLTKTEAKAATCTVGGNIEYYVCTCGKWFIDAEASSVIENHFSVNIAPLGHNTKSVPEVSSTCTENGYTAGLYCERCEQYVKGHISIEPIGHTYTITQAPASCTQASVTVYTCHCGDTYTEIGQKPLGHSYSSEIVTPTCTEDGYTKYVCSICKDEYKDNYKEKLGHAYSSEWITNDIEHFISCKRCGEEKDRGAHIPDYAEATENHGISCTECGYLIQKKLEHIHVAVTHVKAKKATCTTAGNIEYYICACGAKFADSKCTQRIYSNSETVIKAFGHNYHYGYCTNCGDADENFNDIVENLIIVEYSDNKATGGVSVTVKIKNVNMAGISININASSSIDTNTVKAYENSVFNINGSAIKYLLACGENFDGEELEFISFELLPDEKQSVIDLNVNEIYLFDENSGLIVPDCTVSVIKINKI